MMLDMKQLGESIVEVVKTFVAQQIGQVSKRIDALTERLESIRVPKDGQDGQDGKDGRDGINGKNVDPDDVEALVLRAVGALPPAKDGDSVTVDDVAPLIESEVAKAVAAIPAPKDGKDAEPLDHGAVVKDVLAAIRVPEDGKSVTPADVEPMLTDLVAKAVGTIPKPKDGESVPVDQVQRMIDEAVSKAMAAVRIPKDGDPGRDAAHIEILPAIDTEKSYPRGTYAKHAGGQWRSFETTVGMRGWECIQNGVSAIEFEEHEDGRTVTEKHILSDGTVFALVRKSREMKYRGVFHEGDDFAPGDTVTWSGSLWHCNEPTKDKPLDGSKAWQLVAKRGRDGKDGRDGIDFTKPVKLANGSHASGARE